MPELDAVRAITQAVLYEGYLLWPYRRSALKNKHRFTIGGIYPPAYGARYADRSEATFDCLVQGARPRVDLEIRFLQMVHRQVVSAGRPVDEAAFGDQRYLSWDETVERSIGTAGHFSCASGCAEELIGESAALVRTWDRIDGRVECKQRRLSKSLSRTTVRVVNESVTPDCSRDAALRRCLIACHVVLRVRDGAFVSTIDPPPELLANARACQTDGLWPVLVGTPPARDTLLASPIILEEYPKIAPETPCDFFDGCEIGELLTQSILALTEAEKEEMRATDARARAILERVESMTPLELTRLHAGFQLQKDMT